MCKAYADGKIDRNQRRPLISTRLHCRTPPTNSLSGLSWKCKLSADSARFFCRPAGGTGSKRCHNRLLCIEGPAFGSFVARFAPRASPLSDLLAAVAAIDSGDLAGGLIDLHLRLGVFSDIPSLALSGDIDMACLLMEYQICLKNSRFPTSL